MHIDVHRQSYMVSRAAKALGEAQLTGKTPLILLLTRVNTVRLLKAGGAAQASWSSPESCVFRIDRVCRAVRLARAAESVP